MNVFVFSRRDAKTLRKPNKKPPRLRVSAREYIKKLNQESFAGFDDWRLPTVPELISLLEPEQQAHNP